MSEIKQAGDAWIKIRKNLYRQTEQLVLKKIGEDAIDLARYREEFDSGFHRQWQPSDRESLLAAVNSAQIVLMGDFHALQQSQKAQLRILNQLQAPNQWILGVEFISSEHQASLDRFLAGRMSERDFLKTIEWKRSWGFPWEHFKPIFLWAIENKVQMLALNKFYVRQNYETLKKRDQFAAQKVFDCLHRNPDKKIFIIYGDLHLGTQHLPQALQQKLGPKSTKRTVRILQNVEKLYFQSIRSLSSIDIDLIQSGPRDFCLLNVPPWVKWQNYLMYLDMTIDTEIIEEDGIDYTDRVLSMAEVIADELQLSYSRESLSVYTFRDDLLWQKIESAYSGKELKWIEMLIENEHSFYLPRIHAGYLARSSVNHAASLAMQFLLHEHAGVSELSSEMPKGFNALIWKAAVTYFGNKVINPKKKTDTIADIKANLSSRSPQEDGREALQLALAHKMHELLVLSERKRSMTFKKPRKLHSYFLAAQLLGGMLGEKMFFGLSRGLLSKETLRGMFKKDFSQNTFDLSYYEMLEIIESIPAPFRSKKEKL